MRPKTLKQTIKMIRVDNISISTKLNVQTILSCFEIKANMAFAFAKDS